MGFSVGKISLVWLKLEGKILFTPKEYSLPWVETARGSATPCRVPRKPCLPVDAQPAGSPQCLLSLGTKMRKAIVFDALLSVECLACVMIPSNPCKLGVGLVTPTEVQT